jgi:enoyl-CoA hydratase/carnithine racemase
MSNQPVTFVQQGGVDQLILASPILSVAVLRALETGLRDHARQRPTTPLVISSSHPRIFLAGAHLGEIARLDRFTSLAYGRQGRLVLGLLSRYPAPTLAAVAGVCMGGGLDLALSCDVIVASPQARFAHPGVRRGLVTGWGGSAWLPRAVTGSRARRAFVEGSAISAQEMLAAGAALRCSPEALKTSLAEARRLRSLHPTRLQLWRSLKYRGFVDRLRAFVVHNQM